MGSFKPPVGSRLRKDHPLAQGLVGCWIFNEGSGPPFDSSGCGNHGASYNPTWVLGRAGHALEFDGNDYIISYAPTNLPTGNSPITIETWFRVPSTFTTLGYFILVGVKSTRQGYHLVINHPASGKLFSGYFGVGFDVGVTGMNDNQWHHFVGTYDGSTHRTYVDSVDYDTLVEPGTGDLQGTQYVIGASAPGAEWLNGLIGEVRIYNRALPAEEITWLYSEPYTMFQRPSKAKYFFVDAGVEVNATTQALTLANYSANISLNANIAVDIAALTISAIQASVDYHIKVDCDIGSLTLESHQAIVGKGFRRVGRMPSVPTIPKIATVFNGKRG